MSNRRYVLLFAVDFCISSFTLCLTSVVDLEAIEKILGTEKQNTLVCPPPSSYPPVCLVSSARRSSLLLLLATLFCSSVALPLLSSAPAAAHVLVAQHWRPILQLYTRDYYLPRTTTAVLEVNNSGGSCPRVGVEGSSTLLSLAPIQNVEGPPAFSIYSRAVLLQFLPY
ncbi:SSD domain-containing protein [Psidium guajava]|nr:SSD domain-containing protein [Psidium guajava]